MKNIIPSRYTLTIQALVIFFPSALWAEPPFFANGIKIGDLTSSKAIIWTRTTLNESYQKNGQSFSRGDLIVNKKNPRWIRSARLESSSPDKGYCQQIPAGAQLSDMDGATPGKKGWVRLTHWKSQDNSEKNISSWYRTEKESDFTHQFQLTDLSPDTNYSVLLESKALHADKISSSLLSYFTTAPSAAQNKDVRFTVVTGSNWGTIDDKKNGQKIYPEMLKLKPRFFVHTGDIVYYDWEDPFVTHLDLAKFKWNRMYALPYLVGFHNRIPSYFIKDDHDSWQNDCWPGMTPNRMGLFDWDQGLKAFDEQLPVNKDLPYQTYRWGKNLQVWLMEGREFRSSNKQKDSNAKTIWGQKQIQWLKETLQTSDATFKILISPTPIVGPDRANKHDNHANDNFKVEGDMIRKLLSDQKNLYVICGDRHWQYASVDPVTGLREFSCGPTTDKHAGGFDEKLDIHRYFKVQGGFLSVTVTGASQPKITFRFHNVGGKVDFEDQFTAK